MLRFILAGFFGAILFAPLAPGASPIRVMLLDGQSGGPYHAWQQTTPVLKKEIEDCGLFQVTVATAPRSDGDFSNFKPEFGAYRAVVLNYDGPDWPADLKTQFERYIKNGGGIVIVHAADNAFPEWPAFNQMIGIGGWRDRTEKSGPLWYFKDGKLVSDASPGRAGSHGARLPFQVVTRDAAHPIMKGLPPVWMHAADELYATLRGPGENMTVLATAHSDPGNKGTDRDEPILMVLQYGKGRIFHTIMGHDIAASGLPVAETLGYATQIASALAAAHAARQAPERHSARDQAMRHSCPLILIIRGFQPCSICTRDTSCPAAPAASIMRTCVFTSAGLTSHP